MRPGVARKSSSQMKTGTDVAGKPRRPMHKRTGVAGKPTRPMHKGTGNAGKPRQQTQGDTDIAGKPRRQMHKGAGFAGKPRRPDQNDAGKPRRPEQNDAKPSSKRQLSEVAPAADKAFRKRAKPDSSVVIVGEKPWKPNAKTTENTENNALSRHMMKKKLTETRKKNSNPHFELGKEVKVLWETLRKRNLESAERSRLISAILQRMKGKITEMVTSHITSRVLQTCLKYCNPDEKTSIYDELRPHFLELAQNTYSHHLVVKMLDQAAVDKHRLQKMLSSLHGNVVAFLRHPVGSAVVEHAYKLASTVQKQELLAEFFSPEYRLFKGIIPEGSCRLSDLLANEPSSKRTSVLEHMTASLQPILEKGIVDHSIIHRALVEYLSIASKAMAIEVLQQLSGPLLIRMIHTKDGAKLGVTCVAIGSRKERKKIIKGLKGNAKKVACDQHGCSVLMAILDLVDDTEIINKFIVSELANNVKEIAFDRHGRRILCHLLSPHNIQYFSADALTPLQIQNEASKKAKEKDQEESEEELLKGSFTASKKDPFVRRTELLKFSSLAEKLVDVCTLHAGELLRSPLGKDLIYEVAKGGHDGIMWHVTLDGVSRVHQAIADLGAQPRVVGATEEGSEEHVFEQYHASRTIRRLIVEPTVRLDSITVPSFASVLWSTALKRKCRQWANGHSQKIVSAFQQCDDLKVKKDAMTELQPLLDSGLLPGCLVTPQTQGINRKRAAKEG